MTLLSLTLRQPEIDSSVHSALARDYERFRTGLPRSFEETRMMVERITGADGTEGWTVSWKGRGWYDTFEKYLEFFSEALAAGQTAGMPVVPSCKYHLPRSGEGEWKFAEYEYTTRRLLEVWQRHCPDRVMPIEKDFSPTLAGSDRAAEAQIIIQWLTRVTSLIRHGAHPLSIKVGLKVFNSVFGDEFQLE